MAQNNDKYAYFVLLNPKKAKFSFSAYSTEEGEIRFLWNRKDYKTGEPMKRRFEFSRAYRTMRIPLAQVMKDPEGNVTKVVDYLREHPECAGSPNAPVDDNGIPKFKPLFREMNASKDAEIAIAARKEKVLAEQAALELTGAKLEAIATISGYNPRNGEFKEALAIHKCLEAAANDPRGFLKMLSDDTHEMKGFLRKAIKAGVITKVNDNYLWGKILLGTDEDEAVIELLSDVQLVRGIKGKMNKVDLRAFDPADADALAAKARKIEEDAKKQLEEAKIKAAKAPPKRPARTTK
jgi:hypothetical protein